MSRLIVISGLPGTGKTTLGQALSRELRAVYLRVDVVETPLLAAGIDVGPLGYVVLQEVAYSNLILGAQVVVDLVNPWPITRRMWVDLAAKTQAPLTVFECIIPDQAEHRRRVETRRPDLDGQELPSWADIVNRDYHLWDETRDGPRTVIDTTHADAALNLALRTLRGRRELG